MNFILLAYILENYREGCLILFCRLFVLLQVAVVFKNVCFLDDVDVEKSDCQIAHDLLIHVPRVVEKSEREGEITVVLEQVVHRVRLVTLEPCEEGQVGAGVVVVRKLLFVLFLHEPPHLHQVEELCCDLLRLGLIEAEILVAVLGEDALRV